MFANATAPALAAAMLAGTAIDTYWTQLLMGGQRKEGATITAATSAR
jgi:hypothetical protein